MRPAGFRLLAERVAQTEALAVEAALARASTDAQKVEALMNALDRLQEARDNTALHVTAGAAGGEVLTADTALLDAHLDMLDRLARKYGVEDGLREALLQRHDARLASKAGVWGSGIDGAPLQRLTCANIRVQPQHVCTGPASFVCGRCKLVAYCSRECQMEHRATHKEDCRSGFAAADWAPAWAREGRPPSFVGGDPGSDLLSRMLHHSQPRQFLWGNTPAFSLVPKPGSKGSTAGEGGAEGGSSGGGTAAAGEQASGSSSGASSPLSTPEAHLCFAASGDLRNVIATVNALDAEHQGLVVLHVNDWDPTIMARNFVMLLLLGQEGTAAVDAVIQLWYSTAMTTEQRFCTRQAVSRALGLEPKPATSPRIAEAVRGRLLRPGGTAAAVTIDELLCGSAAGPVAFDLSSPITGGPLAGAPASGSSAAAAAAAGSAAEQAPRLTADFWREVWATLLRLTGNQAGLQECMRSRASQLRRQIDLDKRDRYLQPMEPYHRVAWADFYDQGMLLPLGSLNAHHNAANNFLFHPEFGFTLGAGSDPLQGWPLAEVAEAGERHRVPANDLYGALFFYLREQLGEFAARMRSMRLEFRLTAQPAQGLADCLKAQGLRCDFIDTSNIADPNYMGVRKVIEAFGPLLNRSNPEAALVTLFMNYIADMPELDPGLGVTKAQARRLMKEAATEAATSQRDALMAAVGADMAAMSVGGWGRQPSPGALAALMGTMEVVQDGIKAKQDYSGTLHSYLQRKGALAAAAAQDLRPRGSPHRIVPPRFFVPLGAPQNALPFQGMPERQVYLGKCFSGATLLERYVEWVAA